MNGGSALRKLPFLQGLPEPKRNACENDNIKEAREREASRLIDLLCLAVSEMYTLTRRDWLSKYWHSILRHADTALSYCGRSSRLKDAVEAAVREEALRNIRNWDSPTAKEAIHKIANFVLRTQQRIEAVPVLDMLYFRPHYKVSMSELANRVLCCEISSIFPHVLNEFHNQPDWKVSYEPVAALAYLFRLQGMSWSGQEPWQLVIEQIWNDVTPGILPQFGDVDHLKDSEYLQILWSLHQRLKASLEYGISVVSNIQGHTTPVMLTTEKVQFIQRALRQTKLTLEFWARAVVLSSLWKISDPELTLLSFLNNLNCTLIRAEELGKFLQLVYCEICKRATTSVARMALCSKVLVLLEMQFISQKGSHARKLFAKEVLASQDSTCVAGLFNLVASNSSRSFPPEVQLSVGFHDNFKTHDDGSLESELYRSVATRVLPKPIGAGEMPTIEQLKLFDKLTDSFYEHVTVMVEEVQECVNKLPNRAEKIIGNEETDKERGALILNSGNWMCTKDPFVSNDVSKGLESLVKPIKGSGKTYRYQQNWSTVDRVLNGSLFTCSWVQSQVLDKLIQSKVPLSTEDLLGDSDLALVCLNDLSAQSRGFVKCASKNGRNFYAVDLSVKPEGNWTKLRFGDEYV